MKRHRQIITFKDGKKKTYKDIVDIREGTMLTLVDIQGREFIIPYENIFSTEKIYADELDIVVDEYQNNRSCPMFFQKITVRVKDRNGLLKREKIILEKSLWETSGKLNTKLNEFIESFKN